MEKIMRPVWAEINLEALKYNIRKIKSLVGEKEVVAVVKADAYGHGAVDIVPTLLDNGASKLAVAMISEAIELRRNNITAPIMILGYTSLECGEELVKYDIQQTVYDYEYAKELSEIAFSMGRKLKIHIAVDTGMGRIGFMPNKESINDIVKISKLKGIDIVGLFTHFSTSDECNKEYTYEQYEKLITFSNSLKELGVDIPFKHVSNSGAIIDLPETYLDGVRAGIILYGYYPSDEVNKDKIDLKPVLTLKAKIVHIKELDEEMYISYGRTFKTTRKSVIATIPIGYADGYMRGLSNKAKILINGKVANVVGRVCMDQCMVDITDIDNVKVGDEVILLGENNGIKYNGDELAKELGTINYEVLCLIKQRVPRVYIENGEVVKVRNYI